MRECACRGDEYSRQEGVQCRRMTAWSSEEARQVDARIWMALLSVDVWLLEGIGLDTERADSSRPWP